MQSLEEFKNYVSGTLWPQFVTERPELVNPEFKPNWTRISDEDAFWFLKTMRGGLLTHKGRGLYYTPRSAASEQFFWTGSKSQTPRSIFLWSEPIITVAALGKLHFKFGWPEEYLATQPNNWEFDLGAFRSLDDNAEYIACEVKKTEQEASYLAQEIARQSAENVTVEEGLGKEQRNVYRKLSAIRSRKPTLFWIVGPGDHKQLFKVNYNPHVDLQKVGEDKLEYQSYVAELMGFELLTEEQAKERKGKIEPSVADAMRNAARDISDTTTRQAILDAIKNNDEETAFSILSGPNGLPDFR